MDIINIKFDQTETEIGSLGMQGENKKVALHIDCSSVLEKHPGAVILVNYDPRLPGEPYFNLPVTALENGIYEAVLTPMEMACDGLKRIQVRAVEGDYEDRSKTFIAYVEKSVYDFRPPAGPVSDWLDQLRDALAKADAAQQHGPVIGTNGNWYVWQNEAYVDTGVKAEGKDGATGAAGKDGYSPVLTVTEMAGGRRITITDANGTKTFDVLNGENATDEQVREAVDDYMEENPAAGGASVHIGPDQPTNGALHWLDTSDAGLTVVDYPEEPEEPDEPEVTLTGITATYTGGSVPVGTALADLTGIVVTAAYSDGSTETVTGYELSGTIAEGTNTITVTYEGMTATFAVTGVAEEEPDEPTDASDGYITNGLEFRLDGIRNTPEGHDATLDFKTWNDVSGNGYTTTAPSSALGQVLDDCYTNITANGTLGRNQRKVDNASALLAKLANYTVEVVWKPYEAANLGDGASLVRVLQRFDPCD